MTVNVGHGSNPSFETITAAIQELQKSGGGSVSLPLTNKGDLLGFDGTENVRIAEGPQGYYLVSDSAQTPGLGWGRPFSIADIGKEYGLSVAGTAAANATAINQALTDSAGSYPCLIPHDPASPNGSYNFSSPISIPSGGKLISFGNALAGPILNCTVPDGGNGIEIETASLASAVWLEGWQMIDGLGSRTSGVGLKWVGTNANFARNLRVRWLGPTGIQLGDISPANTSDNYELDNIWVAAGTDGIVVYRVSEVVILRAIHGDASSTYPMTNLIRLGQSPGNGQCEVHIDGAKIEKGSLAINALLQIDGTGATNGQYAGVVKGEGLHWLGATTDSSSYLVNSDSAQISGIFENLSTPSGVHLVRDTVRGVTYGDASSNQRISRGSIEVVNGNVTPNPKDTITKGATLVNSAGVTAQNVVVWRAPFNCTVTALKGWRTGGTGATVNAGKGTVGTPANNILATSLSLTSADTWMDGGTVQNTAFAPGDPLIIEVVSTAGTPTEIGVQVEFSVP